MSPFGKSPFDNDFHRSFDNHHRTMRTGLRVFGVAWVLSFLVGLAGLVAVVCIAWHFISKFW